MARNERRSLRQRPSDPYLLFCSLAVLVAVVGAVILLSGERHDFLGGALLIGGDAAVIVGFVIYVRRVG